MVITEQIPAGTGGLHLLLGTGALKAHRYLTDYADSRVLLGTGTMITIIIDDIIVETCNLTRVRLGKRLYGIERGS